MFSYRHAFHAGNHADVLKHSLYMACVAHLLHKEAAIHFVDSHAGSGCYDLRSPSAQRSGEAAEGILALAQNTSKVRSPLLQNYLQALADIQNKFAHGATHLLPPSGPSAVKDFTPTIYPGSPLWTMSFMRAQDRLQLFELHPSDYRQLSAMLESRTQFGHARVMLQQEDGFLAAKRAFPPPLTNGSRRGVLLCDPSYEIKTDYAKAQLIMAEALQRFPTGVFLLWYPIIARQEAHALPRKLKTLAQSAQRPWLNAVLQVQGGNSDAARHPTAQQTDRAATRLGASGVFVINPPYTLKPMLDLALPEMVQILGQDAHAGWSVQAG